MKNTVGMYQLGIIGLNTALIVESQLLVEIIDKNFVAAHALPNTTIWVLLETLKVVKEKMRNAIV